MSIQIIWTCDQCGKEAHEEIPLSELGRDLWPPNQTHHLFDRILCEACYEKAWNEWLAANPGVVLFA